MCVVFRARHKSSLDLIEVRLLRISDGQVGGTEQPGSARHIDPELVTSQSDDLFSRAGKAPFKWGAHVGLRIHAIIRMHS